jgi:hypothetical protein
MSDERQIGDRISVVGTGHACPTCGGQTAILLGRVRGGSNSLVRVLQCTQCHCSSTASAWKAKGDRDKVQ